MISVLSSIFGALVSAASKAVAAVAEAVPAEVWTHLVAAALGAAALAGLSHSWTVETQRTELEPSTLAPERLSYSPLDGLTAYEGPDSVRVDTVRVPASMPPLIEPDSDEETRAAPSRALQSAAAELPLLDGGLTTELTTPQVGYITVPLEEGRPALTITDETATLSGYAPDTGRGLQYEYDVSPPVLEVGPAAWATAPAGELTPGLVIQYRKARLSAGYAPWRPEPLSFRVEISHLFALL